MNMTKYTFHARGMHCPSCKVLIESELGDVAGVSSVNASLDSELVEQTMSALMKYEADIRKAHQELKAFLAEKQAQQPSASGSEKDHLH